MATINLTTGINGSGKTLRLLSKIEKLRRDSMAIKWPDDCEVVELRGQPRWPSGRPVYYFAIPGIQQAGVLTDWIELEPFDRHVNVDGLKNPDALHKLPADSIIVIDEAHRTFKRRGHNSPVPSHVQPFDMARHSGHEFFLCTQDVKDLDPFIRNRIGEHEHLFRVFGLERATLWRWQHQGDPSDRTSGKDAEKEEFNFPKEVYGWYRSADTHVVQKTFPWKKLYILAGFLTLAIAAAIFAVVKLHKSPVHKVDAAADAKPSAAPVDSSSKVVDGRTWAAAQKERVPGIPVSAKFYDALWKAVTIPRISGCSHVTIATKSGEVDERCTCNTQQGTTIQNITLQACIYYVKNGWFDPTKPDQNNDSASRRDNSSSFASSSSPASGLSSIASPG